MSTSLPSPRWRPMARPRHSLPLLGPLVVAALMLTVSIASLTQQFAGASEPVARPRAEIVDACERGSLVVHVLLYDDGSGPTRFTVTSRVADGPTVVRLHDVAGSDVEILEFVVPAGSDATIRVTNVDDPALDRRRQAVSDCAPL